MQRPRLSASRAVAVVAAGLVLLAVSFLFDAAPLFVPAVALTLIGLAAPAWVWASAPRAPTPSGSCRPSGSSRTARSRRRSRYAAAISACPEPR